jgi:DNA-binding PadR family transcriptional regulator
MFRYLVLGLLRDGAPRHGYALMKEYRRRSGLQVSTGNLYRELQRLVAERLVRTVPNPADADARRAPYQITDAGAVAFDAWLTGPIGTTLGRYEDELSTRALFLMEAEPAAARDLLAVWKEDLWLRSKVQERAREAAVARGAAESARGESVLPILLARGLKHVAADIEFLDELGSALTARPDDRARTRQPVVEAAGSRRDGRMRRKPDNRP